VTAKGTIDNVNLSQLDVSLGPEMPGVNVFLDVFLDELLVMPPDRDIEFVIE
jgi:hypothetical protein